MVEVDTYTLTDRDFERITRLVRTTAGINLAPHKRSMVELRVAKRARILGIPNLDEYCALIFDADIPDGETSHLIDVLTTNKTDFFREADHFEWLCSQVLPGIRLRDPHIGVEAPFRVWSAGCSTGQEPYSIAMVLSDYARCHPPFSFNVHGTDICSRALKQAAAAVYPEEDAVAVPPEMRKSYFLRHKDHALRLVRVAPEIRKRVQISQRNLLDDSRPTEDLYEVAFCRNVIIYFERETQIRVLRNVLDSLVPGGFLFVGHSETLHGMPLPAERVGPTLYRKTVI